MLERVRSNISRGSAELVVLSLLTEEALYGFEIAKRIDDRTSGAIHFELASLYPMLYDLEKRGLIKGAWQNNETGRNRRYYHITSTGKKALIPLRREWRSFFEALDGLARFKHA